MIGTRCRERRAHRTELWANFRALIGIFSQSVGPSLAIWANPARPSFVQANGLRLAAKAFNAPIYSASPDDPCWSGAGAVGHCDCDGCGLEHGWSTTYGVNDAGYAGFNPAAPAGSCGIVQSQSCELVVNEQLRKVYTPFISPSCVDVASQVRR